jgi:EmrB/QacA subfamily drug resistance transporter
MSEASPAWVRYGQPAGRWVLLATVLGSGMAFIDMTVVNVALQRVGTELHADASGLQWTVNGYILSLAALILLGGSLGDRFGRKRMFLIGVVWFAVASVLCGIAPGIGALITARVLQGIGGALLTPGSLAILEASFAPEDRAKAIGAWSGLGGIAGAVGPFLGGWLIQVASWRLVFLINAPLAVIVCVIALKHVPESRDANASKRLDVAGVLTGALGLAGLTYGFTSWPDLGPADPRVWGSLFVGVTGMVGFVLVERRSKFPMLPMEIFRSRAFTAANLVTFAMYSALGGVLFLVVLNLQVVAGFGPMAAGTALLPLTVLALLLSARAGALAQRIGPRIPMTVGPLLAAGALVWFRGIGPNASYWTDVLPAVILLGLGLSSAVAPLTATALGSVEDRHAGVASGVNNAVARAATLLAVAVLPLAAGLGAGSLTNPVDLGPVYRTAMLIGAAILVVGATISLLAIPKKIVRPVTPTTHCAVSGPPVGPVSAQAKPEEMAAAN